MARQRITSLGVWMRVKDGGGERLKRRRIREDLTQRDLAFLSRCSQTTIYLLESGNMTTLSEALAVRICKKLDLDVEDIFSEQGEIRMPKKPTRTRVSRRAA